ncbi:alpha/beta hydrolase [Endozoicomonas sp. G2_1]|uniref:alpha/beta hydrolase n=1 Tax=Endozoicomonas sp. G2_1 TaxID=2821091 RepID=UPI001ADB9EB4|nr:alpha/beta hydrolase [Endozoicomonas sp. G2_1]MBO9490449.1 alpha/beta hydrolase [Endozoicomonas sp. G2_1]
MYIISARKDFSHPDDIAPNGEHTIYDINLSNDSHNGQKVPLSNLSATVSGKKVLILVHGYNNEPYEAYDAYELLEKELTTKGGNHYDFILGYSWPGCDNPAEWYKAKRRADSAARMFRRLLTTLEPQTASIDVLSHSLGARVTLKALKGAQKPLIRNYFSTAPAVDNECLETGEEFYTSTLRCQHLHVFHSFRDGVLNVAYRTAEFDTALGLCGPEDRSYVLRKKNIYVVNCKKVVSSHGGYKHAKAFYRYLNDYTLKQPAQKFRTLS